MTFVGNTLFATCSDMKWLTISMFSVPNCKDNFSDEYIYTSDAPRWNTGVTNYAEKASIATTREQSVIVTSQLLATGSCIDDVTICQHFESFRAVTGYNVDLRQFSRRNHINDWRTEYTESEIFGRYCPMSARDLGFRGDSGYFS